MRPSTRSAGKPNTPIRSEARMTRLVTLSRTRPRKPLTSPAAVQRGARTSAGGDVGGGAAGEQLPRLLADTLGEGRAPRQLAAVARDHVVVELHQAARSEEHTSELQSRLHLVCRLLLEKKKNIATYIKRTPATRATV